MCSHARASPAVSFRCRKLGARSCIPDSVLCAVRTPSEPYAGWYGSTATCVAERRRLLRMLAADSPDASPVSPLRRGLVKLTTSKM